MPLTITPVPITEPDIQYDKSMISLAISPTINGNDIDATMSMTVTPYRVLSNGSIESREDLRRVFNSGGVFAEAQSDQALATAATAVWDAIQLYLTEKGV